MRWSFIYETKGDRNTMLEGLGRKVVSRAFGLCFILVSILYLTFWSGLQAEPLSMQGVWVNHHLL